MGLATKTGRSLPGRPVPALVIVALGAAFLTVLFAVGAALAWDGEIDANGGTPDPGDDITLTWDLTPFPELVECIESGERTLDNPVAKLNLRFQQSSIGYDSGLLTATYNAATNEAWIDWTIPAGWDWGEGTVTETNNLEGYENGIVAAGSCQPRVALRLTRAVLAADVFVDLPIPTATAAATATPTATATPEPAPVAGDLIITKTLLEQDPGVPFEFTITATDPECAAPSEVSVPGGETVTVPVIIADSGNATCEYTIEEVNIPLTCTVVGENPQIATKVEAEDGIRLEATFTNRCDDITTLAAITKTLAEGSIEPASDFTFTVDTDNPACGFDPEPVTVAAGETGTFKAISFLVDGSPCTYSVTESSLPAGCSVVGENPAEMTAQATEDGVLLGIEFVNTCEPVENDIVITKTLAEGSGDHAGPFEFEIASTVAGCAAMPEIATLAPGEEATVAVDTSKRCCPTRAALPSRTTARPSMVTSPSPSPWPRIPASTAARSTSRLSQRRQDA